MAAVVLLIAGCGRGAGSRAPAEAQAPCPAGVVAQMAEPIAFTQGWVRVPLYPCPQAPGDAPAARLEVLGSHRRLVFSPGRQGGATAGLLSGTNAAADSGPQMFTLPPGSGRAREVVLAPWAATTPPAVLTTVRLLGPTP